MTQEHETQYPNVPDDILEVKLRPIDKNDKKDKKELPFWLELPLLVGIALVVAVIIKTFLFQAFYIPSSSMEDTLQINDRVLVNKVVYKLGDISRGDVIVLDDPRPGFEQAPEDAVASATRNLLESIGLSTPQSEFIKRVIGLPGDVVRASNGDLLVNGVAQVEPYRKHPEQPIPDFGPVVVPDGKLFVMGDNRSESQDSRYFGPIPMDDVVGKAFVIIWPPSRWSGI